MGVNDLVYALARLSVIHIHGIVDRLAKLRIFFGKIVYLCTKFCNEKQFDTFGGTAASHDA